MDDGMRRHRVSDLADPRLADYRNLRDASLRDARGRFIVEGRGNLRVLLAQSAYRPESILVSETAAEALASELEAHADAVDVFEAPQSVLDAVVGFKLHRGALAVCRRPAPRDPRALVAEVRSREVAPRIVVLEGVRDADNVGGIFRNAMALGARAVVLDGRCCDPLYRKAVRTSMGGALRVPFARTDSATESLVDFLAVLRDSGFVVLALDPKESGSAIETVRNEAALPVALLVGTEGEGLSEVARAAATRCVRIGMEPGVDSLNVATAVAIALHALRRSEAPSERGERA